MLHESKPANTGLQGTRFISGASMQAPSIPFDDADRVRTLHSLNVMNTMPEDRFDALTRAARRMFSVSIAQVSLIDTDRQWIKSSAGVDAAESPRRISFCAHAILKNEVMYVEDARADERFRDNPLVLGEPYIRFYAGCPLRIGPHSMGTFCVIHDRPRRFSDSERLMLQDLARMVEEILETEHQDATDTLTGLTNRGGFETLGKQLLAIWRQHGDAATLVCFELTGVEDVFKRAGVLEAERATKRFGTWLTAAFGDACSVARVGEDDFAVLAARIPAERVDAAIASVHKQMADLNRINQEHDSGPMSGSRKPGVALGMRWTKTEIDTAKMEPMRDLLARTLAGMRGCASGEDQFTVLSSQSPANGVGLTAVEVRPL